MERLFVSTTPGLEPALEEEARSLGNVRRVTGGVELEGPDGLHRRACVCLRTASHVQLRLAELDASRADVLERGLRAVSLRSKIGEGSVAITTSGRGRTISTNELSRLAERAFGRFDSAGAQRVLLRLDESRCTVSVDCAGELLYRRGYRQEISRAPLRETLAAGVLILAGYAGDVPLWDPMCGSGTFVLEGALLALRRAPGLERSFAFESWPGFDRDGFESLKVTLRAEQLERCPAIVGSDLNSGSLGVARRNGRRAAVLPHLRLERLDATTISPGEIAPGLIVANLPYGKRVGERSEVAQLIARFCAGLRARFTGWRVALLVAEPDAKAVDLKIERSFDLDNGGISCRLLIAQL